MRNAKKKNSTEYKAELKQAVDYFFANKGNIPFSEVHHKFFHITSDDITNAIMEECKRIALVEREKNAQKKPFVEIVIEDIPEYWNEEIGLIIEEL